VADLSQYKVQHLSDFGATPLYESSTSLGSHEYGLTGCGIFLNQACIKFHEKVFSTRVYEPDQYIFLLVRDQMEETAHLS